MMGLIIRDSSGYVDLSLNPSRSKNMRVHVTHERAGVFARAEAKLGQAARVAFRNLRGSRGYFPLH
jgi:hypothetical protein